MIKSATAAAVIAIAITGANAQAPQKSQPAKSGVVPDIFAVAALKSLRAVERESYNVSTTGHDLGIRESQGPSAVIDDLDATAETTAETQIVEALNDLHLAHIVNNLAEEAMRLRVQVEIKGREPNADPLMIHEVAEHSPTIIAIETQEKACVDQLETQLRQRHFKSAPACSSDALSVPVARSVDFNVLLAEEQVKAELAQVKH